MRPRWLSSDTPKPPPASLKPATSPLFPSSPPLKVSTPPLHPPRVPLFSPSLKLQTPSQPLTTPSTHQNGAPMRLRPSPVTLEAAPMPLQAASMPLRTPSLPLPVPTLPADPAGQGPASIALHREARGAPSRAVSRRRQFGIGRNWSSVVIRSASAAASPRPGGTICRFCQIAGLGSWIRAAVPHQPATCRWRRFRRARCHRCVRRALDRRAGNGGR